MIARPGGSTAGHPTASPVRSRGPESQDRPHPVTAPASLPDDELVRRARAGRRDAFAVLYHRYVRQVHALVGSGSPDAAAAEATTVAVFCDLLRHLSEVAPDRVTEMLEHHAQRRIRGRPARTGVPPLTVGALDRMWREIDRRWPTGDAARRDGGTMVPITAGALVAVLFLGTLASTSRQGGVPDPNRSFEATAVRDDVGQGLLPGLPRPRVTAGDEGPAADPTVAMSGEPTSEPTTTGPPEPVGTEDVPTEEAPTEEPDAAPTIAIRSPSDGSTRRSDGQDERGPYATVVLDGVAVDDRDPADALAYAWTSSIDGVLADTPSATARLHVPDGQLTASHLITFSATDSAGNSVSTSVTVVVTRV